MKFTKIVKAERDLSAEINDQEEYADGVIELSDQKEYVDELIKELTTRLNEIVSNESISYSKKLKIVNNSIDKLTKALFPLRYQI